VSGKGKALRLMKMKKILVLMVMVSLSYKSGAQKLYVCTDHGDLLKIDVEICDTTFIGNTTVTLSDIAICSDGILYGTDGWILYQIDTSNAQLTTIDTINGIGGINALVCDNAGNLLAAGLGADSLYALDKATGLLSSLGYLGYYSLGDLAFYHDSLFLIAYGNRLIKIDLSPQLSVQLIGEINASYFIYGLATIQNSCEEQDEIMLASAGRDVLQVNPVDASSVVLCTSITDNIVTYFNGATPIKECAETAIPLISQTPNFHLSPNPATTYINIVYQVKHPATLTLTNSYGNIVKQLTLYPYFKNSIIYVDDLAAGIYLVTLREGDGSWVRKVVIER